jgi:hypothetical protein
VYAILCQDATKRSVTLCALSVVASVFGMTLRKLAGDCELDDCPAVFLTEHDSLIIIGTTVNTREVLRVGSDEQAVELPIELVREALGELGR